MRQIISISLPEDIIKKLKNRIKHSGFASISEYFKYLFEADNNNTISDKELMAAIIESRKEYKKGKTIKADSLADLL
ncbi:hypothetical protein CO116_01605 [Candidatus Falkowbacteria bacterium CG_4_9_14_3_um_filter_38_19]|uniref:CopG family transcriptional regulator n=2 Tax=Candidatus Falkowiibacteriota TaxID=1752728 RepID=A0A2M8AHC4_9BACT|nr:hypothetical protein [Candidatus Parcubacteria bacterium]PJB17008.1 MAG: hypothetical protein CO116_01605 [Candidatus Falkowbacteria bacterium CG_4_9_14_3_um_filter_38_19]